MVGILYSWSSSLCREVKNRASTTYLLDGWLEYVDIFVFNIRKSSRDARLVIMYRCPPKQINQFQNFNILRGQLNPHDSYPVCFFCKFLDSLGVLLWSPPKNNPSKTEGWKPYGHRLPTHGMLPLNFHDDSCGAAPTWTTCRGWTHRRLRFLPWGRKNTRFFIS